VFYRRRPAPSKEVFPSFARLPADKGSIKMKLCMEQRWNDTPRKKLKLLDKNLSHCHLVNNIARTDWTLKNFTKLYAEIQSLPNSQHSMYNG
jgi:hypothetical protein